MVLECENPGPEEPCWACNPCLRHILYDKDAEIERLRTDRETFSTRLHDTAHILIEAIGATGPEDADSVARRTVAEIERLRGKLAESNRQRDNSREMRTRAEADSKGFLDCHLVLVARAEKAEADLATEKQCHELAVSFHDLAIADRNLVDHKLGKAEAALAAADRLGLEVIHQRNKEAGEVNPEMSRACRNLWNSIQERATTNNPERENR